MGPFLYHSFLSLAFMLTIKILVESQSRKLKNLPPGSPTLPIIGNLHQIKPPIHISLTKFSETYEDIISLWFGSRLVVVLSSFPLAQECFVKNDVVFANRPRFLAGKHVAFNYTTIATASYGEHWYNIRRIATTEVLSTHRLNSFVGVREDEIRRMVRRLGQDATSHKGEGFVKVVLRPRLTEATFNNIMRMISGKKFYGDDCPMQDVEEAKGFREIIDEMQILLSAENKPTSFPSSDKRSNHRSHHLTKLLPPKILTQNHKPRGLEREVAQSQKACAMKNPRPYATCEPNPPFLLENLSHGGQNVVIHDSDDLPHTLSSYLCHQSRLDDVQRRGDGGGNGADEGPTENALKGFNVVLLGDSKWLYDFEGINKRMKKVADGADAFLEKLIEEHRKRKSMIDVVCIRGNDHNSERRKAGEGLGASLRNVEDLRGKPHWQPEKTRMPSLTNHAYMQRNKEKLVAE
ncbi:hypothetical protein Fmac_008100 [Flemingia macrophylla]|uniref:Uncharacterized protein n=1 Tax=Flemingia macrophylla TaxID=520843 RepID=A0ABD1MYV3_9FABA